MNVEELYIPILVVLRAISFTYTAPLLGDNFIPPQIKAFLAVILGVISYFELSTGLTFSGEELYVSAIANLLVGGFMGMLLSVLFSFFSIGGYLIAMGSGLGFASMADPNSGGQTTVIASFYKIAGLLVYVCFGGILSLLMILSSSYDLFPLEIGSVPKITEDYILNFFSFALESGLLLAAPMIFTVFLMNLSFGIISKASQGFSVFSLGFPIGILITFLVMTLSMDSLPFLVKRMLDQMPLMILGTI